MKLHTIAVMFGLIMPVTFKGYCQSNYAGAHIYGDSSFNFIEINAFVSSQKRIPFWIQANQFGIVPAQSPAASFHAGLEHYRNISGRIQDIKAFRIGGGIEAVANYSGKTKMLLPQIFVTLRAKNWELFAGRKKQWVGLADSTLGMGSYAWSGNALPIPKIQIGTSRFIYIPLTGNLISFNAFYSEGIFENKRATTSKLKLHQKALYIRLGRPESRLRIYGGFNHQVQWGGKSPYHTVEGKMPGGLRSYYYIITGKPHAKGNGLTHFDSTNRIGNHLGSIDLAVELDFFSSSLFLYRQNIYEDGSLYYLSNIKDGLNGIRFKRRATVNSFFQITEAVVEFLYTKSQGGPIGNKTANIRGKDDYFNNAQVRDGWSYYDRTIGVPFITPTSDTKGRWPNYSDFFTNNNRVAVWHLGLDGTFLDRISWYGKFSYSSNSGTYDVPFNGSPKQFSGLLSFQAPVYFLGGTILKGSLAADTGKLYPKTFGFSLGIRKEGFLNIQQKRLGYFRY